MTSSVQKKLLSKELSGFLRLKSPDELVKLLKISAKYLHQIVENPQYRTFYIPKKSGNYRLISAPEIKLKNIQHNINKYLQKVYAVLNPGNVYGFVKNFSYHKADPNRINTQVSKRYSIIENAKLHINKNTVLNLDIKDFFSSISIGSVRKVFASAPFYFNSNLSTCLSLLLTWNKSLPAGSPSSPVLSNLFCFKLDKEFLEFAKKQQLTYSRYADDITFSGESAICDGQILAVRIILANYGFVLNEKKIRIQNKSERQEVTGIIVNNKLNVDRRFIRWLRAVFYDIEKRGYRLAAGKYFATVRKKSTTARKRIFNTESCHSEEMYYQKFFQSLDGKIEFIGNVRGREDLIFQKFKTKLFLLELQIMLDLEARSL